MNAFRAGLCRTFPIGVALLLAAAWLLPAQSWAEKGEIDFIPGTLVSLEKDKGKNYSMKMKRSDNEEEMEVLVGPKVPYRIVFKGDADYLKKDAIVSAHVVQKGTDYSTGEVTVFLALDPPLGSKDGPKEGENKTYDIVGKVLASNSDGFTVDSPNGGVKVALNKGSTIWVTATEPALAKPGALVNVEGTMLKKFNATSVEIKSEEAILYDEYEKLVPSKKSATKRSTRKTVKKDDGDDDSPKTKKKPTRKKPSDDDASY